MSRLPFLFVVALFPLSSVAAAPSPLRVAQHSVAVNADAADLALHGYDAVAYFADGVPTKGTARYTATYQGARYQFANNVHLKAFEADPGHYAPQFGGFCALGTAYREKVDTDPETGKVVNGKLYLNNSVKAAEHWESDRLAYIAKADAIWPSVRDQAPQP